MVSKTMSHKTASYLCYSERCYFCKQTKDKQRNGTTRNTITPNTNILLLNDNTHKVKLRKTAASAACSLKKGEVTNMFLSVLTIVCLTLLFIAICSYIVADSDANDAIFHMMDSNNINGEINERT